MGGHGGYFGGYNHGGNVKSHNGINYDYSCTAKHDEDCL